MSSVGKISLDLSLNNKQFDKQVKGIEKTTTKAFGMMSVAIGNIVSNMLQSAVAGVGNFVKDSINKGSELSELQNVVDSVYGSMSERVNQFSRDALEAYGLTEAQAKKMMGTFGAMSKSFGYSTEQAYTMSSALTGLAGDVASFYNLNIDEAYTKLKSVCKFALLNVKASEACGIARVDNGLVQSAELHNEVVMYGAEVNGIFGTDSVFSVIKVGNTAKARRAAKIFCIGCSLIGEIPSAVLPGIKRRC